MIFWKKKKKTILNMSRRLNPAIMPPAGKPTGMRIEERLLDVPQAWEARESARSWHGQPPSVGGILSPERVLSTARRVVAVPGAPVHPPASPQSSNRRVAAPTSARKFARTRGAAELLHDGGNYDDTEYTHHPRKANVVGGNRSFRARAGLNNSSTRPVEETEYGQAYAARASPTHVKAVATDPMPQRQPEPESEPRCLQPTISEYSSRYCCISICLVSECFSPLCCRDCRLLFAARSYNASISMSLPARVHTYLLDRRVVCDARLFVSICIFFLFFKKVILVNCISVRHTRS